jgi:hypothetical protein
MDADMMTFSMCINVCAEMYKYINVPTKTVGRCTTDRKEPGVNICEEAICLTTTYTKIPHLLIFASSKMFQKISLLSAPDRINKSTLSGLSNGERHYRHLMHQTELIAYCSL